MGHDDNDFFMTGCAAECLGLSHRTLDGCRVRWGSSVRAILGGEAVSDEDGAEADKFRAA